MTLKVFDREKRSIAVLEVYKLLGSSSSAFSQIIAKIAYNRYKSCVIGLNRGMSDKSSLIEDYRKKSDKVE